MKAHDIIARKMQVNKNAIVLDYHNSHGSWLVDVEGKRRLDCFSQYGSQPIGWNHPKLLEQATRLNSVALHNPANSDCYTSEYCDFVEAFEKITPDFNHYFFISGGTLGVENAIKTAFDWKAQRLGLNDKESNRLDVIHFEQAFHGRSGYTLSLTNTHDANKYKLFPKFQWTRVPSPKTPEIEKIAIEKIETILNRQAKIGIKENNVAAIIIEPIQAEGGDNHFRPEFFTQLRKLADDHQCMLIFDEVQTGVGMTGKMWCYEHFNMKPDMICFGKKTQVCGFAANKRVDEIPQNVFNVDSRLCSTWGGNLTDMVRATIYFEIIEEDKLVENAKDVGACLLEQLSKIGLDNLRGRGLIVAFDMPDTASRNAYLERLSHYMLALKCGEKSVRLRPHLTLSKAEAEQAVEFIRKAL